MADYICVECGKPLESKDMIQIYENGKPTGLCFCDMMCLYKYGKALHKATEHYRLLEEEAEREEKVKQFIKDMHKNRRSNGKN